MTPLIHPVTKSKIRFVDVRSMEKIQSLEKEQQGIWSNLLLTVDRSVLEKDFGGDHSFVYDHSVYWPEFSRVHQKLFFQ